MVERRHSGSYQVNEGQRSLVESGWCGMRFTVVLAMVASFIIYIIGAIITGFAYRGKNIYVNCTTEDYQSIKMFAYKTPLVVVGPCFMSAGTSVLLYLLLQWFLCRPALK